MNSISYRKWDIWTNNTVLVEKETFDGYFECDITPTLMAKQALEFLYENNIEFNYKECPEKKGKVRESFGLEFLKYPSMLKRYIVNDNNQLCIKIRGKINANLSFEEYIINVLKQIDAISMCLDITLNCDRIIFKDNNRGQIFYALRRPLGRGVSFEVEERAEALNKIDKDFMFLNDVANDKLSYAIKHYLAGINLLGLEDQFSGLIEAAFMQFYLGCEILCNTHKCEEAKKYIATLNISNKRDLQIIAHQVWQVRNQYYGHMVSNNTNLLNEFDTSSLIAKQVLVARYLCRILIDTLLPSKSNLVREIGLYPNGYSESFNGSADSLSRNFFAPFYGRMVKIYDEEGNKIDDIKIDDFREN